VPERQNPITAILVPDCCPGNWRMTVPISRRHWFSSIVDRRSKAAARVTSAIGPARKK
jgi:hypothetical protein